MAAMPRVPQFKVLKLLGKGSYGKVYKVERESDGQIYAMKETDLGTMAQEERMDAVNEVRLLVSINHANVIRYHETFVHGHKLCVVMEYAPYGDLTYYLNKGKKMKAPFPEEAIWRIFLQLCKGLVALHGNLIVHRDIKPANIFLCQNDLLKIGDLGIAKALHNAQMARTQIGTPCYMAPEVWAGKPYSFGSDLWSLGSVLYEMMTFRTPMEGRTMQELKSKIVAGRFTPVAAGRYSPELVGYCHLLLNADPRKRPALDSILRSSAASKWLRVLPSAPPSRRNSDDGSRQALLDTIQVPRDLRQLPRKLPPPCYDSDLPPAPAPPRPPLAPISRQSSDQLQGAASYQPQPPLLPPILSRQNSGGSSSSAAPVALSRPRSGSVPPSRQPEPRQPRHSAGGGFPIAHPEPPPPRMHSANGGYPGHPESQYAQFLRPPVRRSVVA